MKRKTNSTNGTQYSIAFTRNGRPNKMLNMPEFFVTPADAKKHAAMLRARSTAEGHKNFGIKWDYMVVAITQVR